MFHDGEDKTPYLVLRRMKETPQAFKQTPWVKGRGKQGELRRRRELITYTDELHIHFAVLLHVLQQVHVEGLSLKEGKEPSPLSLHLMGCCMHCDKGWLIKRAEHMTGSQALGVPAL